MPGQQALRQAGRHPGQPSARAPGLLQTSHHPRPPGGAQQQDQGTQKAGLRLQGQRILQTQALLPA